MRTGAQALQSLQAEGCSGMGCAGAAALSVRTAATCAFRSNLGAILQRQGQILPVNLPRGTGTACDFAKHIQFKTLPRGAQAGVARAPALRSLNLHGCDIGDEGCARF